MQKEREGRRQITLSMFENVLGNHYYFIFA